MMVMSIAKTAADYLGELEYLHTKMEKMDVIHFPAFGDGILAVVLKRPFDEASVAAKILRLLHQA
jgi:predicted regulator of Ras-like GTPase activity (Roadblock/LC7/MglB family)